MARSQPSSSDVRARIRRAEAALRQEVRASINAEPASSSSSSSITTDKMNVLREHAKRLLRARLWALKDSTVQVTRYGQSPSVAHRTKRKKLMTGGADAILVEYGVPIRVSIGAGGTTAPLTCARCSACGSLLVYFDPHEQQIEAEQLACISCGAMFELDGFVDSKN